MPARKQRSEKWESPESDTIAESQKDAQTNENTESQKAGEFQKARKPDDCRKPERQKAKNKKLGKDCEEANGQMRSKMVTESQKLWHAPESDE